MTTPQRAFCVLATLLLLGCCLRDALSLRSSQQPPKTAAPHASSSGRRQWLLSTASGIATAATTVATLPANADPSVVSSVQGPVQDVLAPGHWIGQFIGVNSHQETWDFPEYAPSEVSKALVDVLEGLTEDRKEKLYMPNFDIKTADDKRVHVLTWTKLEWLDALDVTLQNSGTEKGCTARAKFYATGFLPTSVPGAPLFNVALFPLPFGSPGPRGELLQDFRLRALKGLVTKKLQESHVTPDLYV